MKQTSRLQPNVSDSILRLAFVIFQSFASLFRRFGCFLIFNHQAGERFSPEWLRSDRLLGLVALLHPFQQGFALGDDLFDLCLQSLKEIAGFTDFVAGFVTGLSNAIGGATLRGGAP